MGYIPPPPPYLYSPGQAIPVWKSWFAWYPVKVKGQWCWLKKVYRARQPSIFARRTPWIYGDIFDVLSANTGKPLPPPGRILNH